MKYYNCSILALTIFLLFQANNLSGQSWNYVKEENGIKLFTHDELNSTLNSFRGEVIFKASIEKVNLLVGNANNLDWWDKNISFIKVLAFEKDKYIRYYIIFDVSWPLSSRDLALDAQISTDPVTGIRTVMAKPLLNVVPEKEDLVRIKKYWQKWTVQPLDNGYVKVTLEGFVDPNGDVPSWIYNMVVTETPLRALESLRARALSAKPANN